MNLIKKIIQKLAAKQTIVVKKRKGWRKKGKK